MAVGHGGAYDARMKMFIPERCPAGVRLVTVNGGQPLGWECGSDQEVDFMIKAVKAELDQAAKRLKASLAEQVPVFEAPNHA